MIDPHALIADAAALVRIGSVTGDERAAAETLVGLARGLGLEARLAEYDLAALRAHPDHPGEEAPRTELVNAEIVLPGTDPAAPRTCLCGHLDVVGPGSEPWLRDPWSGAVQDGRLHGRGSVDMKGAVVAALHAMAATGPQRGDVVLLAVAGEEDGGLGAFAALERDADFAACLIPEPTGFEVCCAQAGALTFTGRIRGRAAHAAVRLEGDSALDRYVEVHARLRAHEEALNAGEDHPLMAALPLPYPVSVGRLHAGEWSSSVPEHAEFEGRLGVRLDQTPADARAALAAALGPEVELEWTGGQFAPGSTPPDHPWVARVVDAVRAEGRPGALCGVPYGADLRHFAARGIPTVMLGTGGLGRAHAVDEWAATDELVALARVIRRVLVAGSPP